MHRGGTSAVARILSLLGADLPRDLLDAGDDNPSGFWEPKPIMELNDELLASAGSAWDDVSGFPASWYGSPPEGEFRELAVQQLEEQYPDSKFFVLKDPRICRLVPFWVAALDEFGAVPVFVTPVRNPLEVAASLKERNGFSTPKGLLLWLRHVLEAEHQTRGHPRVFISYERLLEDWEGEARAIADHLQISWPRLNHSARDEVERFLEPRRRHQHATLKELSDHTAVVDWVTRCYAALEEASRTGDTPPVDLLAEISGELERADRAYGPLLAGERRTVADQEEELESARGDMDRLAAEVEGHLEARNSLIVELDGRRARATMAQREVRRLERERNQRLREVARLRRELRTRGAEAKRRRVASERDRLEVEKLRARVEAQRRELADREQALAVRKGELDSQRSEVGALAGRAAELEAEHERLQAALAERDGGLSERTTELERLQTVLAERDRDLSERATKLERLQTVLAERDRDLSERAAELATAEVQLDHSRAEAVDQSRRRAEAEARLTELRAEADEAATRAQAELQGKVAQLERDLRERERTQQRLETQIAVRSEAAADLTARLNDLDAALERLAAEAAELRERSRAELTESALTYLEARPRARLRTALRVIGWSLRPGRMGLARDFRTIRRSGQFDATFYLLRYPKAASAPGHPALHYVERGASEGMNPNADFDTRAYLNEHPELAESGRNPFAHFLRTEAAGAGRAGPPE